MNYTILFTDIAVEELQEVVEWLEEHSSRRVIALEAAVVDVLDRIEDNPFQFPTLYKDRRKAVVLNFPYLVLFFLEEDKAVIIGIVHQKRNPKRWQEK